MNSTRVLLVLSLSFVPAAVGCSHDHDMHQDHGTAGHADRTSGHEQAHGTRVVTRDTDHDGTDDTVAVAGTAQTAMDQGESASDVEITFGNGAGWEIRFSARTTGGSCRAGMEKSFQLDGNKVYWSGTGTEQTAWRCVTGASGRQVRLVASSPQPATKFADVGLGRVVASGKRIAA